MRTLLATLLIAVGLTAALRVSAQDHPMTGHHGGTAPSPADLRQLVHYPPDMRDHTLANMRDHLATLSAIIAAMSSAEYAEAARIADARLGMDSPSAAACKPGDRTSAPHTSSAAGMDHQMLQFMPAGMRDFGLQMHQSASTFAAEAAQASKGGNPTRALAALSRVTQNCVACHAAYRLH